MTKKTLVIGPRIPPIGGASILFDLLVDELDDDKIIVVNTSCNNTYKKIILIFKIIYIYIYNIKKINKVHLHLSVKGIIYLAPVIRIISIIYRKKMCIRKFGGSFDQIYNSMSYIMRKVAVFSLNCDIVLFETKKLRDYFQDKLKGEVLWYPNYRKNAIDKEQFARSLYKLNKKKKYIFIGHIKHTKGVGEICEVFSSKNELLSTVDIFGPIHDHDLVEKMQSCRNINYRGVVKNSHIIHLIAEYDALLLPTYHEGEGYPGVIIESYMAGRPVITTDWNSISEIVIHNKTGKLIPPKDCNKLYEAIKNIEDDDELWVSMCKNAYKYSSEFDVNKWASYIMKI